MAYPTWSPVRSKWAYPLYSAVSHVNQPWWQIQAQNHAKVHAKGSLAQYPACPNKANSIRGHGTTKPKLMFSRLASHSCAALEFTAANVEIECTCVSLEKSLFTSTCSTDSGVASLFFYVAVSILVQLWIVSLCACANPLYYVIYGGCGQFRPRSFEEICGWARWEVSAEICCPVLMLIESSAETEFIRGTCLKCLSMVATPLTEMQSHWCVNSLTYNHEKAIGCKSDTVIGYERHSQLLSNHCCHGCISKTKSI